MLFFGFESMHPKHTETVLFVLKVNHHMFEVPSSSCWLQLLKCLDKRQLRSTSKYYFIVETSISNLKLAIKHEKTCNNSLRILFKMSDLHKWWLCRWPVRSKIIVHDSYDSLPVRKIQLAWKEVMIIFSFQVVFLIPKSCHSFTFSFSRHLSTLAAIVSAKILSSFITGCGLKWNKR